MAEQRGPARPRVAVPRRASREMTWALGTLAVALVVVVGVLAALGGGFEATEPTPTAAPSPSPTGQSVALGLSANAVAPTVTATATASATATLTPTATITATATPARSPTPTVTPTPNVRKITSAELTLVLRGHIESQRAQFQDGKTRFVVPDKVVIDGKTPIRGQAAPVEAELTVGVDGNGRPRILAYRLTANGQPAPPEVQAALAARVTQTNTEIGAFVPPGQHVKRVWVTNNPEALWAEMAD